MEVDFYIFSENSKENLLFTSTETQSSNFSEPAAVVVDEVFYIELYESNPGASPDIWQTHEGKLFTSLYKFNIKYSPNIWQPHKGKLYIS